MFCPTLLNWTQSAITATTYVGSNGGLKIIPKHDFRKNIHTCTIHILKGNIICFARAIKIKGIISWYQLSGNKTPAQACLLLFFIIIFHFPSTSCLHALLLVACVCKTEQGRRKTGANVTAALMGDFHIPQGLSINNNKWANAREREPVITDRTMYHLYLCCCGPPVSMLYMYGRVRATFFMPSARVRFAILFPAKTYANVYCPAPDRSLLPLSFRNFPRPFLIAGTHINKRKMRPLALTINNNFLFSKWIVMNYKRQCETCLSPGYGKWAPPTQFWNPQSQVYW